MILYLIRHTQPDVQAGICYGQTNLGLADSFQAEVEAIKARLGEVALTHSFSSPLQRCFKLAQELSGKKLIHTDDRLMELNFGDWEMKSWDEINQSEAGKIWFSDFIHKPCPNGECYINLQDRIINFMQGFKSIPDNSQVLIVTHAGPIRSFLTLLEGVEPTTSFDQMVHYGDIIKLEHCFSQ